MQTPEIEGFCIQERQDQVSVLRRLIWRCLGERIRTRGCRRQGGSQVIAEAQIRGRETQAQPASGRERNTARGARAPVFLPFSCIFCTTAYRCHMRLWFFVPVCVVFNDFPFDHLRESLAFRHKPSVGGLAVPANLDLPPGPYILKCHPQC